MTDIADVPVAILAGGRATRLGSLSKDVPKALIPVAGRPFVDHQLALLSRNGVRRVVLCVGHLGDQIAAHVGDGECFGVRVEYAFDGPRLLGTGGALRRAGELLGPIFWVVYGDAYLRFDYAAVLDHFLGRPEPALMTVYRNEGRWDQSNVVFQDGRVVRYDKRQPTSDMAYIDYGAGLYRSEALARIPTDQPYDLGDLQAGLAAEGRMAGYEVRRRFYEVGSLEGIREIERYLGAGDREIGLSEGVGVSESAGHRHAGGREAVFLDRDGTLIRTSVVDGVPKPPGSPEDVAVLPGVSEALERLREAGFLLIVVTNQPDVARGTATRELVETIHAGLRAHLAIDAISTCYDDDVDDCACRKPRPGLLVDAADRFGIDLRVSFMVGDRWRDTEAGRRAGCTTVLLRQPYSGGSEEQADYEAADLPEAAEIILRCREERA